MIKYVIFDLSEVIISGTEKTEFDLAEMLGITVEEVGEYTFVESFKDLLVGKISEDEYINDVLTRSEWNMTPEYLKELLRKNFLNKMYGVEWTIKEIKDTNKYTLVLLSDHAKEWVKYILEEYKFLDIFDKKYFSYELGYTKENVNSFKMVLEVLHAKPEECIFVDNNINNVHMAESIQIKGIHYLTPYQLREDLRENGII